MGSLGNKAREVQLVGSHCNFHSIGIHTSIQISVTTYVYAGSGGSKSKHSAQPHARYVNIRMHIDRLCMNVGIV